MAGGLFLKDFKFSLQLGLTFDRHADHEHKTAHLQESSLAAHRHLAYQLYPVLHLRRPVQLSFCSRADEEGGRRQRGKLST